MRKLAYQIAKHNNLMSGNSGPYASKDKFGQDWLNGFLKRHPEITPKTAEATSAARARGFNREVVGKFFDMYE